MAYQKATDNVPEPDFESARDVREYFENNDLMNPAANQPELLPSSVVLIQLGADALQSAKATSRKLRLTLR